MPIRRSAISWSVLVAVALLTVTVLAAPAAGFQGTVHRVDTAVTETATLQVDNWTAYLFDMNAGDTIAYDLRVTGADHVQRQVGNIAPHVQEAVEAFFGRQPADGYGVARFSCYAVAVWSKEIQVDAGVDHGVGLASVQAAHAAGRIAAVGDDLGCLAHSDPIERATH